MIVLRNTFGGLVVEMQYHALWVAAIKHLIPYRERDWNSISRVWVFNTRWYHCVLAVSKQYFDNVVDLAGGSITAPQHTHWKVKWAEWLANDEAGVKADADARSARRRQDREMFDGDDFFARRGKYGAPDYYSALFVLSSAPKEVVEAAYRALAKLYHPDKGGDPEKMKVINHAYDQLKKGWS